MITELDILREVNIEILELPSQTEAFVNILVALKMIRDQNSLTKLTEKLKMLDISESMTVSEIFIALGLTLEQIDKLFVRPLLNVHGKHLTIILNSTPLTQAEYVEKYSKLRKMFLSAGLYLYNLSVKYPTFSPLRFENNIFQNGINTEQIKISFPYLKEDEINFLVQIIQKLCENMGIDAIRELSGDTNMLRNLDFKISMHRQSTEYTIDMGGKIKSTSKIDEQPRNEDETRELTISSDEAFLIKIDEIFLFFATECPFFSHSKKQSINIEA